MSLEKLQLITEFLFYLFIIFAWIGAASGFARLTEGKKKDTFVYLILLVIYLVAWPIAAFNILVRHFFRTE